MIRAPRAALPVRAGGADEFQLRQILRIVGRIVERHVARRVIAEGEQSGAGDHFAERTGAKDGDLVRRMRLLRVAEPESPAVVETIVQNEADGEPRSLRAEVLVDVALNVLL